MSDAARTTLEFDVLPADYRRQDLLRRLLQNQVYDPLTRRLLSAAGLRRGMRVLDLGGQLSSAASVASEMVGPEGRVISLESTRAAADLARKWVERGGPTNIEFRVGDQIEDDRAFDAIVGRFFLRGLAQPAARLRSLARCLAPGGFLALQEKLFAASGRDASTLATCRRVQDWIDQARLRSEVDLAAASDLPRLFVQAGLPAPMAWLEAPIGVAPDWIGFDYLVETLRGVLPLLQLYGIVEKAEIGFETLLERMRTESRQCGGMVCLTACLHAWTCLEGEQREGS